MKKRSSTRSAASSTARPPEGLCLFLDESLDSPTIAAALTGAGAEVVRLTQRFPRGTQDEVWLAEAGRQGWAVLTRDKRIRYRPLEKMALQGAGVRSFVFTGGNVRLEETAEILARALPGIRKICNTDAGPSIYHIGRSGKPLRVL